MAVVTRSCSAPHTSTAGFRQTHTHTHTYKPLFLLLIDTGEVKDVYTGAEVKRLLIIDAGEVKDVYTDAEVKRY